MLVVTRTVGESARRGVDARRRHGVDAPHAVLAVPAEGDLLPGRGEGRLSLRAGQRDQGGASRNRGEL